MGHYFRWLGVPEREWRVFQDEPCPPDILGCDYYVTSERFLDDRLALYPPEQWGSNHRDRYVDVEAVRVRAEGIAGPAALLREAWDRYGFPLALTEAHLASTCDEQMRWVQENWDAALALRAEGADVRAVTAWALLGAYEWNSLVTRTEGYYEPGAFALCGSGPQPTSLAAMLRDLPTKGAHDSPALESPGWWRREDRLLYPAFSRN